MYGEGKHDEGFLWKALRRDGEEDWNKIKMEARSFGKVLRIIKNGRVKVSAVI